VRRSLAWTAGLASGGLAAVGVVAARGAVPATAVAIACVVAWVLTRRRGRHEAAQRRAATADALRRLDSRSKAAVAEARRVREAAEAKHRERDEFLAAVSHELRTPLNAIQGFSQVLLDEIDGPLNPSQREDLETILGAGAYLRDLVDEVLDASADPDSPLSRRGPTDVGALVRDVARLLEGQRRERPIDILTEMPEPLPLFALDGRRVRQILVNLGTNAMKLTRRGHVLLSVAFDERELRIAVADTGPGIAKEDQDRIFRAHERLDPAPRARVEGWGLGLAIALEMVQLHGGRIEVRSDLGTGSTFTVVLPRAVPA